MKNILITILSLCVAGHFANLSAQCEANPNAAVSCDLALDARVCDISELVGCFIMSGEISTGNQPEPLCLEQGGTTENIAWINFRAPEGDYSIVILPKNCSADPNGFQGIQVGVYTDCTFEEAAFCNSNCNVGPVEIAGSLLTPGEDYFLFIDGCNLSVCEYDVEITGEYSYDSIGVMCIEPEVLLTATAADCDEGDQFQTVSGTIDSTCMQGNTGCDVIGNTAWYQIDIDSEDATELITKVVSAEDVVWSIYTGIGCQGNALIELYGSGGDNGLCSSSDGDNGNTFVTPITVEPGASLPTYWIAITNLSDADTAAYTLYYTSALGCGSCAGEGSTANCQNGDYQAFVDDELSDGPFCRGEEVTVCLDVTYNSTATGNDWLHGIIPTFGSGWDISELDFQNIDIGQNFDWFSAEGPCAPRLNGYSLPNMCTYVEDGRLKFCNTVCNPDCPCEGPLLDGSPIPSGWFVNTGGGSPSCGADCSPASFYGVSGGVLVNVNVCFPLKVKEFVNGNCEESTDLSISIQMTADAITGCWEDTAPCAVDPSINSPAWKVNCEATTTITAEDATVCSGDVTDITIETTSGVTDPLQVTVANNPNIEGEGEGPGWSGGILELPNGSGVLEDILVNTSNTAQTVLYSIINTTNGLCGNTTVAVTVLPTPTLELVSTFSICEGEEAALTVDNAADFVSFVWTDSTGVALGTAPILTIEAQDDLTVFVEATNADGCSISGSTEIIVGGEPIREDVEFSLCPGEVVEFNGISYGEEGTYQDSLVLASGCVVTYYDIAIVTGTAVQSNVDTTICLGQTFMNLSASGTYTITIPSQTGCDTVLSVVLEVIDEPIVISGESQYCEGDTVILGDQVIVDGPGMYQDSIFNAQGCLEQVNNISYTFSVSPTVSYDTIICEGESVLNLTTTGQYTVTLTTSKGCDSTVLLGLTVLPAADPNCLVGIEDLVAQSILVYPNPATDLLYVESSKQIDSYVVTDVTGKRIKVLSEDTSLGIAIDLSDVLAGVYMLQVRVGDQFITKKLVVQ